MKDNREIIRGIRMSVENPNRKTASSKTFVPGMEDELAAAFTDTQLKGMVERGDITGNWKSTKGKPVPTK